MVDREPTSVWPAETVEVRSQRLLEAVDQTHILDWTPEQKRALQPTVVDFLSRELATQATLQRRANAAQALVRRVQIIGVLVAAVAIFGSFGSVLLASHLSSPAVVVQTAASPTPTVRP